MAFDERQVDVGVFENEDLIGLVTLTMHSKGVFEAHLSAKKGAPLESLIQASLSIRHELFELGMIEGFVFVASLNRTIIKLCELSGFRRDGVRFLKGKIGNRVIEWVRLSTNRREYEQQTENTTITISAD